LKKLPAMDHQGIEALEQAGDAFAQGDDDDLAGGVRAILRPSRAGHEFRGFDPHAAHHRSPAAARQ
jgi:hypothetical protein